MRHFIQRLLGGTAVCGLGLMLCGCSADYYRRDADRQVYSILRDRKFQTVGYTPQVEAGAAPVEGLYNVDSALREKVPTIRDSGPGVKGGPGQPVIPAKAYSTIPTTLLPPIEPVPLELPATVEVFGPLGPFLDEAPPVPGPAGAPAVPADPATTAPSLQPATQAVAPPSADPDIAPPMEPRYQSLEERVVFGKPEERLAYGPPAPFSSALSLGIFESLQFGIEHSRDYRTQMDTVYLQALDVTLQRHLFEPRAFANLGLNYTGGQRDAAYKSAVNATMDAGVRQRLPYGGEIVAEALVNFVNTVNGNVTDGESAQLALSGSIPLLRGAGLVNLDPLITSERTLIYRIRDFEDYRRRFAVDIATQYLRVLTNLQSVNNRRLNVDNLTGLLKRSRDLYTDPPADFRGRQTFLDVQRAEQSLLTAQDDLIRSQVTYLNSLDDLKVLLGMDMRQDLQLVPVALDVNIPDIETRDVVAIATKYRLDLQTARDQVDDARRLVASAQNGLLPDLNLTAQSSLGNRNNTPGRELDSRNLAYSAGVTLDLPIDRLAERNIYRQSLIAMNAAQRTAADLKDRIAADVRTAVRSIRQAQSSVTIQRRSIELAQRRLENANILIKLGKINNRDYVEAQSSLLTAQDRFDQAQADLQVQVLQFLRLTGLLRVDPGAATLGRALDRDSVVPITIDSTGRPPDPGPPTPSPQ